jgi:hypothetical protein
MSVWVPYSVRKFINGCVIGDLKFINGSVIGDRKFINGCVTGDFSRRAELNGFS